MKKEQVKKVLSESEKRRYEKLVVKMDKEV
jgi:hypothetical protein